MSAHKPNHVPGRVRAAVTVIGLLTLQFAVAAAANGLVYLPGKRSEVMLSGLPTLLIVIASLALTAVSALHVIDHHDRRPNEASYQAGKRALGWLAFGLYVAAPLMEHLMPSVSRTLAWHLDWFDLHPETARRWMAFIPPEWRPGTATFMTAFGLLVLTGLLSKLHPSFQRSRLLTGLGGAGFALLGGAWMVHLLGEVSSGRLASAHGKTLMLWSDSDPARFQALVATYSTLAMSGFCLGILLVVGACLWPLQNTSGNERNH